MRNITSDTRAAVAAEVKDGPTRYWWRATVEHTSLQWYDYDTDLAPGGDYGIDRQRTGHYSSMIFRGGWGVHEIPNIKSGQIIRDLNQDIAELTLTVLNTVISPMGDLEDEYTGSEEYDVPGVLSFNRAAPKIAANRWGHDISTGWEDLLCPDRILKTYEGYGIDPTVPAGWDPNMYASGFWLIDSVVENADGDLVIKARDLARLLSDHIAMPPNIPWDSYPMEWSKIESVEVEGRELTGGSWWRPRPGEVTARSSNEEYIGAGISDTPAYVGSHGQVMGHNVEDPLRDSGYWLSTGQAHQDEMVWWELDFGGAHDISGIKLKTFGGPFVIYVSVHNGTDWVGTKKIPYRVGDVVDSSGDPIDLNAKIRFIHRERFERSEREEIIFKRAFQGIHKLRITFTRLRRQPGAEVYPWRAGVQWIQIYRGAYASLGIGTGTHLKAVGNYTDYTTVVKWICAWSGFWWPERDSNRTMNYGRNDSYDVVYDYLGQDQALVKGRVWGSFEKTNTGGVADLTADQFDKQPLLDCIQVIRNIVGFNFFVDECGGIVWRMPNILQKGNYITKHHRSNEGRLPTYDIGAYETIDENDILLQYNTTLDSKNLRERIGVTDTNGKIGTVIRGYVPYHTGLRRISLWTDEHFDSNRECRIAADMIAAQQMFSFRQSTTVIPANPAIQIDDQVRIFERVTDETFFHYVTGLTSSYDAETGKGEYTLQTHWLGERISDAWVIRVDQMDALTQSFLNAIGPVE
jgi:hypothetical protein